MPFPITSKVPDRWPLIALSDVESLLLATLPLGQLSVPDIPGDFFFKILFSVLGEPMTYIELLFSAVASAPAVPVCPPHALFL